MSHNPRISLSTIDNIGRLTQAGTDSFTYDESIDTPLSITNANGTFYYHRDHQGSIVALTDSSGQVVESFQYDNHYGTITNHTKDIETNNPYAYTGRELDTDELYYYRARYYDPQIERFVSEDPIGFASGDFNWYRYVGNNSVGLTDPSGLSKESGVGGCDGKGTKNPYKHCKEVPGNPNMIECKDKKTGKKKRKPKPADWDKYKKVEPIVKPWLPEITVPSIDWEKVKQTSKQIVIIGGKVFVLIGGVLFAL